MCQKIVMVPGVARAFAGAFLAAVLVGIAHLATAPSIYAQGYNILSGRNHPELIWQVAETEHVRIMYPNRLAGIEAQAAALAEASYAALSSNLDVTFGRKIDIYLSDEDEMVNGFAVPIGSGYTNIWVHVPDFARSTTGSEKWLRVVIPHELAHIFHYQKSLDRPRWVGLAFGRPLPRFWTEGIAQYQTEKWTAQRGDRWLRTAVLDDRLSYSDGRSPVNGRLLYAVGHSQVRYLTDRYGDSTLVKVLAHRRPALLGLAHVHDFGAAFRAVTGSSYRSFYDEWRRHVNVYYNSLAAAFENVDSLGTDPLGLPGQFYSDVAFSPDTSRAAVISLTSLQRPVQRLWVADRSSGDAVIVAEGALHAPIAWSPDGSRIAYTRTHRGHRGSLVRDLFVVDHDGSHRRQLTQSRRAGSPAFSPDGRRLAFIASDAGVENVYILSLDSSTIDQITSFEDDVQLSSLRWHPEGRELLLDRFRGDGVRDVAIVDLPSGRITALTDGTHDDRDPVYSPSGEDVAYVSLRDDVPNVFVFTRATGSHARVTRIITGATVTDWLPSDSLYPGGSLIVISHVSKSSEEVYRIDARRRADEPQPVVSDAYASWTAKQPPAAIPSAVPPNADLITDRYPYRSWRNLRHVASLAFPYARVGRDLGWGLDWGLAGLTTWLEPLGKHALVVAGGISVRDPLDESYVLASYVNNQWVPTIALSLYRLPSSAQAYGNDLLVEAYSGGDITMTWPLDWLDRPYNSLTFSGRIRLVDVEALAPDAFESSDVPTPEEGQQADVRLAMTWRAQRPYVHNVIHPLDGVGLRLQVLGAGRVLGTDTEFVRGDAAAFVVLPSLGRHRLFVYGRVQVQTGSPFSQHFIGLSRHDAVQIPLPALAPLFLGDAERVRGFRTYALGDRLLFGSMEYRVPLLPDLQTRLLGLVSFGSVSGAAFADAGLVWSNSATDGAIRRMGLGLEVKNALTIGPGLRLAHAVGVAQPARDLGNRSVYEVYYRIRTSLPF